MLIMLTILRSDHKKHFKLLSVSTVSEAREKYEETEMQFSRRKLGSRWKGHKRNGKVSRRGNYKESIAKKLQFGVHMNWKQGLNNLTLKTNIETKKK